MQDLYNNNTNQQRHLNDKFYEQNAHRAEHFRSQVQKMLEPKSFPNLNVNPYKI